MAIVHNTSEWQINGQAAELHEQGLRSSISFHTDDARTQFGMAQDILAADPPTDDRQVQLLRIERDAAFTYARDALRVRPDDTAAIDRCVSTAKLLLSHTIDDFSSLSQGVGKPTSRRERELRSERGAARSMLDRTVIVRQVALGQISEVKPTVAQRETLRSEQAATDTQAHRELSQGPNTYYYASDAVHRARVERLSASQRSEYLSVAPWLGRAVIGIGRSLLTDRGNFLQAAQTTARVFASMRSRRAAIASIRERP